MHEKRDDGHGSGVYHATMVPFGARFPYLLGREEESKSGLRTAVVMAFPRPRTSLSVRIDLAKAPATRWAICLTFLMRVDNVRQDVWRAAKLQATMAQQPQGGASMPSATPWGQSSPPCVAAWNTWT